MVTRRLQHKIC